MFKNDTLLHLMQAITNALQTWRLKQLESRIARIENYLDDNHGLGED